MLNGLDHNAAMEYAEAFNLAIANDGAELEGMLERWHKNFTGDDALINNEPTNYQLAWLRGIESAGIMLNDGPRCNLGTIVLDERFQANVIYGG